MPLSISPASLPISKALIKEVGKVLVSVPGVRIQQDIASQTANSRNIGNKKRGLGIGYPFS